MKKLLFLLFTVLSLSSMAQVYNNEWIDYNKTYYKFKLAKTGLYRIRQAQLAAAGIPTNAAESFQLWRNGSQVPLFTTVTTGALSGSDYIEFWGRMNDGLPDKGLYRDASYQLNDKWSLFTDTSSYFLTINTNTANNLRLTSSPNPVSTTSLTPDPYFMYTSGKYFHDHVSGGYAVNVGENLFSSSFDKGEGWVAADLTSTVSGPVIVRGSMTTYFPKLKMYAGGPAAQMKIATSGYAINQRRFTVVLNSDSIMTQSVDFFNTFSDSVTLKTGALNSVNDTVKVIAFPDIGCYDPPVGCQVDRMEVHRIEMVYPRIFDFDNASSFEFQLAPSATGNYLRISNFSAGSAVPVLYDLTSRKRYDADLSEAGYVRFVLPASVNTRFLVLTSEDPSVINTVNGFQKRTFTNFANPANQGNYLIVSHPVLRAGANGTDPVSEYAAYRSTPQGGAYNAKVVMIDELMDQFAFGIAGNPASIRNFVQYALKNFDTKPKQLFIIGHGINYISGYVASSDLAMTKLNLVPTFGYPASDVLLTCPPGSSQSQLPVGRLAAINPEEVFIYLKKVKDYEGEQAKSSPLTIEKAWMKNFVHIVGASEPELESQLNAAMKNYSTIISDTLYGANVELFNKGTSNAIEQLNSTRLQKLFSDGISVISYLGHSSTGTLEFNLDNPQNYNNFKKYPLFVALGCNAGDFFRYIPSRLDVRETLSEKFVITPDRGTIGFIASTHFGIVHYLDIWANYAYEEMAGRCYDKSVGELMLHTSERVFDRTTQEDFYARCNAEQSELHGDPAILLNPHQKPDYVIEDQMVTLTPFISVAEPTFPVKIRVMNLGRAINKPIVLEIKRQLPGKSFVSVYRDTIPGTRFLDSFTVKVPIIPTDKGINKVMITIDADGTTDEAFEDNNSVTKEITIYEEEARPVFPANYAIMNKQGFQLIASTANPYAPSTQYRLEVDTTEAFNSPIKVVRFSTGSGGPISFDPGMSYTDSTVYYWRVAPVLAGGQLNWNKSSFIYIANSESGFAQKHFNQMQTITSEGISLNPSNRKWQFGTAYENLFVKAGTWVTSTGQEAGLSVAVNSEPDIRNTCWFQSVVFNVFDPISFKPWFNTTLSGAGAGKPVGEGLYKSASNNCNVGRQSNFEYRWDGSASRKDAADFMNNIVPDGAYVVVRSFLLDPNTYPSFAPLLRYAQDWKTTDDPLYGASSLYNTLKNAGFATLDSFNRPRQFVFIYKKNDPSFQPKFVFSDGTKDNITLSADCPVPDTTGRMTSPVIGPALQWNKINWNGYSLESTPGDDPILQVIGVKKDGAADTLYNRLTLTEQNFDIASVDAATYPYLQFSMKNTDRISNSPYQLRYWQVTYKPAPEGAVAASMQTGVSKDTVEVAEPFQFEIPFKNISDAAFPDSLQLKLVITDRNNVQHTVPVPSQRPLAIGDTVHIRLPIDTRQLVGSNLMFLQVNPNPGQPEQALFNNVAFKSFYVRGDTLNPMMDVTFDNVHIVNNDVVLPKPTILIKLKDEAKWYLMNDPSKLTVTVRKNATKDSPEWTRTYKFDSDTLQFFAAKQAPTTDNSASAVFKPYFPEDGTYELSVSATDMSNNKAGSVDYRVNFQVYNKAMISNLLNYPNPFTTSTAFVFTLTGSEIPQNLKIEIMTVTGKVVRQITKEELGPLRIGRNITEFKWDGTDQYGQKLANGVYLYRVVTNLNGKSLDKFSDKTIDTDKYFNKGYGKMYLMR